MFRREVRREKLRGLELDPETAKLAADYRLRSVWLEDPTNSEADRCGAPDPPTQSWWTELVSTGPCAEAPCSSYEGRARHALLFVPAWSASLTAMIPMTCSVR